ncbi:MAG: tetratricopeptide repeat protein [Bacteroidetes bacterium]|nr:tetratricopeptide repeat protein [Bacteroidota bacterium]
MQRKFVLLFLASLFVSVGTWAQCTEYKWPQDQATAEKKADAFKAAIKDQNYKAATGSLKWLMTNAPQWHSDLYVAAIDTYDKLAAQEVDPAAKQNYIDSLMLIYDLRIQSCGDEMNVLNRKAISAIKYNGQNKEKLASVLAVFDKTFEVSGNNVYDNNLFAYMTVIKNNADQLKNLSEDQIVQRYNKLTEVIDSKVKRAEEQNKSADIEKYKKVLNAIDGTLAKTVKFNCAFAKKVFEPKFKANPNDVGLAKKVYQIMLADKCTDEPSWLVAAEVLYKANPEFGVTKELCQKYIQNKSFDKAAPLLTEIQSKASTPAEKAWIDLLKGDIEFQKGNKPGARDAYKAALTTDPTSKDGFEKMGDLYVSSAGECSKEPGSAEEKLVYIAAFQQYKNSGNREKMEQSLAKYPTAADLTKANWKAGESKKLACWIDETVVVKARKE